MTRSVSDDAAVERLWRRLGQYHGRPARPAPTWRELARFTGIQLLRKELPENRLTRTESRLWDLSEGRVAEKMGGG